MKMSKLVFVGCLLNVMGLSAGLQAQATRGSSLSTAKHNALVQKAKQIRLAPGAVLPSRHPLNPLGPCGTVCIDSDGGDALDESPDYVLFEGTRRPDMCGMIQNCFNDNGRRVCDPPGPAYFESFCNADCAADTATYSCTSCTNGVCQNPERIFDTSNY